MALTNAELQAQVRAGLGRGASRTDLDDLIVQSLIMGADEIARRPDDCSFLELNQNPIDVSLVQSQNYIDLSSVLTAGSLQSYDRVHHIYSIAIIDGSSYYPIGGMNARKWGKEIPSHSDTDTESRPTTYCRIDDRLYFYPVPDQAYTIRMLCSIWPTTIQHSSGTITSGSNPGEASAESALKNKDSLLIAYGVYWAATIVGNIDLGNKFFGIFEFQLKNVLAEVAPKADNYPTTGGTKGATEEVSAPSAGASAGTDSWDAVYRSTPHWD